MSEKLLQAWDLHLRQFLHDAALKVCRVLLMIQLLLQTPTQHVSSDGKKKKQEKHANDPPITQESNWIKIMFFAKQMVF